MREENDALRLTRLGLEVDLYWGSRLAGKVPRAFQKATVESVSSQSLSIKAMGGIVGGDEIAGRYAKAPEHLGG